MTTATTVFMTIVRKVVGGMSSATPKYTFSRQSSPWRGAVTRRWYAQALRQAAPAVVTFRRCA